MDIQGIWLVAPGVGFIRLSTVAAAVVVVAVVLWRRRSIPIALAAVMGWAASYELIFNGIGVVAFRWPAGNSYVWGSAAILGWVLYAAALKVWPDWRVAVIVGVLIAIWVATGYHSNVQGRPHFSVEGEVLNEVTKSLWALGYLVGAIKPSGWRWPSRAAVHGVLRPQRSAPAQR